MAWPHLAQHPEVGGEGEIGHRGVEAAAPGRVALPHLKIYVSTSQLILAPSVRVSAHRDISTFLDNLMV